MKIVSPSVTLLHCTPDPERVIERAGRVCWKSEDRIGDDSHVAFIRMLKKKGHESVLEHASAGFMVVTDRGISHEIVRHRVGMSYSQESTRYCCYDRDKFGGEITVVRPSFPKSPDEGRGQWAAWKEAMVAAEARYFEMLNAGASPQIARSVLPTCLKTELAITGTFRAWRHFLTLRLSTAAHPDIRSIARFIADELVQLAPTVFEEWNGGQP